MAGLVDIFKGLLGGDPIASLKDLIAQFHASPEQKAALVLAEAQIETQREQIQAARDQALADIQGQNVRAETTSSDWFVRRARPAFLYMMTLGIGVNIVIFPLVNALLHKGLSIPEIPAPYLELFGAGFLGYTGARTWEKLKGAQQ